MVREVAICLAEPPGFSHGEYQDGYGEFYEKYEENPLDELWDVLGKDTVDSNIIEFTNLAKTIFKDDTLKEMQELYMELSK